MGLVQSCVEKYGANPDSFVELGTEVSAEQLQYETIALAKRKLKNDSTQGLNPISLVKAVYECQFSPLIYLIDGSVSPDQEQLQTLRYTLAMRGDAPYMGVVSETNLDLYPIALDNREIPEIKIASDKFGMESESLFTQLSRWPDANNDRSNWIADVIRKLLLDSIDKLLQSNIELGDSISLVGRALFTRFLADRNLLPDNLQKISKPNELFDNPESAKLTSNCLDSTFNGDFLPLSDKIFSKLSRDSYQELGNVLNRSPGGQFFLAWEKLDFEHVPVGILSQVYESVLKKHFADEQRSQSAYYTPSQIVNLMVKKVMLNAKTDRSIHNIKVLDPAAGAGVFLITAFRELVAERWKIDNKRPNTKTLRSILENQISGFEVNESALRFAALGLYLISIELDPNPELSKNLKFKNLRGSVLHNVSVSNNKKGSKLGSLNPKFLQEHKGKYDVVIGNPPWKLEFGNSDWNSILTQVKEIAHGRNIEDSNNLLPRRSVDLAFLWYAMGWTKENGIISLVLHSRWLFQHRYNMREARLTILDALDVRSIIDCSKLRFTKLWPNMTAPFCLLFAKNQISEPFSQFKYFSPNVSQILNDSGRVHIDETEVKLLTADSIRRFPQILKLYSRGSIEDHSIFERMRSQTPHTIRSFWQEEIGGGKNGPDMFGSGVGYRPVKSSTRDHGQMTDSTRSESANKEDEVEILKSHIDNPLLLQTDLCKFSKHFVEKPRNPEIFKGPLMLVDSTLSSYKLRINASVYDNNANFSWDIFGYSMHSHVEGFLLARFLCLILRSKVASWQLLLTSGRVGVERPIFKKFELDNLLAPDFRKLTKQQKQRVNVLFDELNTGRVDMDDIDKWAVNLYGLGKRDLKVISDTLEFNAPFPKNLKLSESRIVKADIDEFKLCLSKQLNSLVEFRNLKAKVEVLNESSIYPWKCLNVYFNKDGTQLSCNQDDLKKFKQIANSTSSHEFIVKYNENGYLVGKFSQKRYWNFTQSKLLADKIIRKKFGMSNKEEEE